MPLYEFLRLARGKLESAKQKTAPPTDVSSVPENDVVELVWENGEITTQGQSNRAKKSPDLNDFPSQTSAFRERYMDVSTPKVGKFGGIESTLNDALPSVPSGELYLNQEDEMGPWLNYSGYNGFRSDFYSENLPEISGVTGNEPSSLNSFASMGKGSFNQMLQLSHTVPVQNGVDSEVRNAPKVSSSRTSSFGPYSPQQCQISVPSAGSEVLSIDVNTACNKPDALFGDSVQGQVSLGSFLGMKMQKEKPGLPGKASSVLNFSHFSRPAALFRSNIEKTDCLAASCSSGTEKMGVEKVSGTDSNTPIEPSQVKPCSNSRKDFCFHNQPKLVSAKVDCRTSVVKLPEELCSAQQSDALLQEDTIKYDKSLCPVIGPRTTKEVKDGENPVEAVLAASSVCSGNSGDRASNDQMHKLKRKNHDNEESESRSEDIEEESVPIRKAANARGGSGSKRSRAAEVHNLSERRRRDRINEKMRALQELIPNCNKADKASMLDEAIEYLKTLQLQVQMMSMGAGLCMPPMMFPTGLQHMHTALVPHFPPMGAGMGMGMGFRMGILDMSSGSPRFPVFPVPTMQGTHFHSPPISGPSTFQGLAGSSLQVFGHPSRGVPISIPRVPLVPLVGQAPICSAVGSSASRMGFHVEAPNTSPNFNSDVAVQDKNSQLVNNTNTHSLGNQTSNQLQATNKDIDRSATTSKDDQAPDVCGAASANLASTTDAVSNKEVGSH